MSLWMALHFVCAFTQTVRQMVVVVVVVVVMVVVGFSVCTDVIDVKLAKVFAGMCLRNHLYKDTKPA